MGKIQSAITGLVMTSLGAVATGKKVATDKAEAQQKQADELVKSQQAAKAQEEKNAKELAKQQKMAQVEQEKAEVKKISDDAYGMYGKSFEGANEKQQQNLINRQKEANRIANEFITSQKFQREAFKQRIARVGGTKTPEGQKLLEASKTAYEMNLSKSQEQMDKLRKRVYNKKKGSNK